MTAPSQPLTFLYLETATPTDVLGDVRRTAPLAAGLCSELARNRLPPEAQCKGALAASCAVAIAAGTREEAFVRYARMMFRLMEASQRGLGSPAAMEAARADLEKELGLAAAPPAPGDTPLVS